MRKLKFIVYLLCLSVGLTAQSNLRIGFKGSVGTTLGSSSNAAGFELEHKFSKSLGYDFAVFHKTITAFNPVNLHFIHLPVSLKFYTQYINVSAGLSADYFIGHSVREGYTQSSADVNPAFQLGFIGKVSKDISITKHLVLEPEVYLNPFFSGLLNDYGLAMSFKYSFNDKL